MPPALPVPCANRSGFQNSDNAPPRPLLHCSYHRLEPVSGLSNLSANVQQRVNVMQITWEAAHGLGHFTRGCKESETTLDQPFQGDLQT